MRSLLLALAVSAALAAPAAAQVGDAYDLTRRSYFEDCTGDYAGGHVRYAFCETRNYTLPPGGELWIESPGSVTVEGWDRAEVYVLAVIIARSATSPEQAAQLAPQVQVVAGDDRIQVRGPNPAGWDTWTVTFHVLVPYQSELRVSADNNVLLCGVNGRVRASTLGGDMLLDGVAGDVRVQSGDGDVEVVLRGTAWTGAGLEVESRYGSIQVHVPEGYSARFHANLLGGPLRTTVPLQVLGQVGQQVSGTLGEGGPPIRLASRGGRVTVHTANTSMPRCDGDGPSLR